MQRGPWQNFIGSTCSPLFCWLPENQSTHNWQDEFTIPCKPSITKPLEHQSPDPKNAVHLALELKDMLDRGVVNNQSELAERIGFNRARISQILNLLKLPEDVVEDLAQMEEPYELHFFTERRLRHIAKLKNPLRQRQGIRILKEKLEQRLNKDSAVKDDPNGSRENS